MRTPSSISDYHYYAIWCDIKCGSILYPLYRAVLIKWTAASLKYISLSRTENMHSKPTPVLFILCQFISNPNKLFPFSDNTESQTFRLVCETEKKISPINNKMFI